jgi:hypothetical protein
MTTRVFVLLGITLLTAIPAAAQQDRASIRGVVLDPSGRPVPAVQLRIMREATAEMREATSDEAGRFAVTQLLPGIYRVDATHTGFGTFVGRAELHVNQDFWLDVKLPLGNVVQAVEVSQQFVPVDRGSPAISMLIDSRSVANLPLDGRNFLELALLSPGAVPAPQGSASSIRGDFAFSVNGAREDFTGFLLDGVYNIDPKLGTVGVRPAVDAIREFQVLTSSYDASFGRNAGGQVNVVTRSGSNRVDGTAYEFLRDDSLGSRNHFAPSDQPAPAYSRHQFGASIGGPIVRDRTFFFADYERTRLREGITRITQVPTLAERAGDFSQSLRSRPVNPFTQQPFPDGRIPSAFIHPVGSAIASLYPAPNRASDAGNFVSSPTLRDDIHQFDGRIDHSFGGGTILTTRYSFSDRQLLEPFAGPSFPAVPGFGAESPRRGQNFAAALTHSPTSSLVNDLRFGFNRVAIGVFAENEDITNESLGLPALSSSPRDAGLSVITIAGYSPLGHDFTTPQESASDMFQIADTATWLRGAHLLKFGGEWYGGRQQAYRDVQARGFLTFVDQAYTGNALADLLMGLPALTGGARLDNPQSLRTGSWSVFAHDEWRAASTLTLSAGLRYDYASPPVDADDRANLYDVGTGQLVRVGTEEMPRGGFDPDRNNLAPRVGFAWTLDRAQVVVRGGYGIYYNQGALATSEGLFFNPPFFNLGVFFPLPGLPPLTLSDPFPASFPVPIPQSATAYQRDLQTPRMQHWNVNVQRQIGRSRAIEVAYVGSRGHNLISARDVNQPPASANLNNLRPNPQFADITLIQSRASSRYDSLQVKMQQRSITGLSVVAAYTLGKSTDDASGFFTSAGDPNFPQDSLNPGAERGRSAFDVRHRISVALSYPLPFGPEGLWLTDGGWLASILADLELHAVITGQSGRPFTVILHPDIDNSNTGRSNLGFGFNDRPNVTGDPALSRPTEERWFDTTAFSMPPFGSFGNAERNVLDGPGYRNLNMALVKHVRVGETTRLQLRLEAFNLWNRANFDLPDAVFGSPTFGRILSAQAPRRFQLGIKALF